MHTRLAAVVQDVGVQATGILQGIGKNWHSVEGPLIVDGLGDSLDRAVVPGEPDGVDRDGPERVAEEVVQQCYLKPYFRSRSGRNWDRPPKRAQEHTTADIVARIELALRFMAVVPGCHADYAHSDQQRARTCRHLVEPTAEDFHHPVARLRSAARPVFLPFDGRRSGERLPSLIRRNVTLQQLLDRTHRCSVALKGDLFPDTVTALAGEVSKPPITAVWRVLPLVPVLAPRDFVLTDRVATQELDHRYRVVAFQPFRFSHGRYSLPRIRLTAQQPLT